MKVGYIRSEKKGDQFYEEQHTLLANEGCERIFEDLGADVKGLEHILDYVRSDDKICIYQMDRLGLSIKDLIGFIHDLLERGVHIASIKDHIDTATQEGRVLLKIFNVLGLCEQNAVGNNVVLQPTYHNKTTFVTTNNVKPFISTTSTIPKEVIRAAGRPKGLTPQAKEKAEAAASMYQDGNMSMREIANNLNISTATLYSYLRHEKVI